MSWSETRISNVFPYEKIDYSTCEEVESLDDTERGDKGFGSSGKLYIFSRIYKYK